MPKVTRNRRVRLPKNGPKKVKLAKPGRKQAAQYYAAQRRLEVLNDGDFLIDEFGNFITDEHGNKIRV